MALLLLVQVPRGVRGERREGQRFGQSDDAHWRFYSTKVSSTSSMSETKTWRSARSAGRRCIRGKKLPSTASDIPHWLDAQVAPPLHDGPSILKKMGNNSLDILLDNHRTFLAYLERKVGDRATAEDILQDAFAKIVERPDQAPDEDGVIPWFYRTLRNAAIDRFRRRDVAERATEAFARELETHTASPPDMEAEICACVSRLAGTLKPEYAEALRAIDVEGTPVKAFATQHGLSPSNAGVRVFRAREALKKRVAESCGVCAEHGCLNCTCRAH